MVNLHEIGGRTGKCTIRVGEGLARLRDHIPASNVAVITDPNVSGRYSKSFPPCRVIEIGTGETVKTLDTVRDIYARLLEIEADRSTFIVGIGGGIVCDIAGFVASTFQRGLRFGLVPTTLLAQVDAGVGGKNGVNLDGCKNVVGVISQPEFVLCDMDLLRTLPEVEVRCGLAEVVKHGVIADPDLFVFLERNAEQAARLDPGVVRRLVNDSISIKAAVVNGDEREWNERRKLNFGHTLGHAIEANEGFSHGEAVSLGMAAACRLSVVRGMLAAEASERIIHLLSRLGLPTSARLDGERVMRTMRKDKKRSGSKIHFVFLKEIGEPVVEPMEIDALEALVKGLWGPIQND